MSDSSESVANSRPGIRGPWRGRVSGARASVVANLAGGLAIQSLGVVTGTLLARGLGPHDRGVIAAMVLWPTLVVAIGDFGIGSALAFYAAQEPRAARRYVQLAERAAVVVAAVLMPVGVLIAYAGLTESGINAVGTGLLLALVFIPAAIVSRYIAGLAQGLLNFGVFYAIRLSMSVSIAVVLAIELLIGQMSVASAVAAYLVGLSAMVVVTVGVKGLLARGQLGSEPPSIRVLTSYGLRSLFGALYPAEILFVDQIIVAVALGPRELGLYAAALAFTTLPRVLAEAIATAAFPHVTRAADPRRPVVRFLAAGALVLLPCGVALTMMMPWLVVTIFGPMFSEAIDPAKLLIWGSILFGLRRIAGDALRGLGVPGRASAIEAGTWPIMVGVLAIAARDGLAAVAVGLVGVQMLALAGSLIVLGRALREHDRLGR